MKYLLFLLTTVLLGQTAFSQPSFVDAQKNFPRVATAMRTREDSLKKQFVEAGLKWPAKEIYIRSFKYDSQLEVWVKDGSSEKFKLFKTYKVCAMAGSLGPKRMAGDYQVPEGFYYINRFNPKSNYHLALGLNYPNASDKILSDSLKPGGDIYIHGTCLTVGCIPLQNQIEDLYILAANARASGQDYIPVHIFPVRFDNSKSMEILEKTIKEEPYLESFCSQLKEVYEYFDKEKKLPLISINSKGEYVLMQ